MTHCANQHQSPGLEPPPKVVAQQGPGIAADRTVGEYRDESEAAAGFDRRIGQTALFKSYPEREGWYIHPSPKSEVKRPRIDRILAPTAELVKLGWREGVIGVEIKASGVNIGPPLSQCMDYLRAVYELPAAGVLIVPSRVFLWPMRQVGGPLASIMAQNRVGCCWPDGKHGFSFVANSGTIMLRLDESGEIRYKPCAAGYKAGSR